MTIVHEPPHPPPLPEPGDPQPWQGESVVATLHRNRHVSVPVLLPLAFLLAGAVLSWHRRPSFPTVWHLVPIAPGLLTVTHAAVVTGGIVTAAAVWLAAPHKWDRDVEVTYARASAALGSGWLALASFAGITWWTLALLAAGCTAWGIPWYRHKRPRAKVDLALLTAEWDAWWQHYAPGWGLGGSKVVEVIVKGVMETLTVQLLRGRHSHQQVTGLLHLIESALDGYTGHGMVRIRVNRARPSQVLIVLRRENPLREPVQWDASLVPASITQPAPVGVTESGELIMACLLMNWFIIGRSRSGKSNEFSEMAATITGVPDARLWLIDRKGGRSARPWMPAVDWVAVTIEEIRLMLQVADAEVRGRAMHAYNGEEQLRPTAEVPAIFIGVDEAAEVTGINGEQYCANLLASIASMGMGVAVYVVVLTQYGALEESVRTEQTRSNLIFRMCFQVDKREHGEFALADFASLDASKLEHPGEFYWKRGPKASSEPGRGHEMAHALVRDIAARNGTIRRRPMLLYATEHQETYDTRWSRLPEVFVPLAPQAQGVTRAPLPQRPEETPVHTGAPTGHDEVRADAEMRAQRIEDEIAAAHPTGATEPPQVDDAVLRRKIGWQKRQFAHLLQSAGDDGISPKKLIEQTGLARSTVQTHLRELTSAGALIRVGNGKDGKGAYRAAPGEDIWEAMEKIREGEARLLEDARSALTLGD